MKGTFAQRAASFGLLMLAAGAVLFSECAVSSLPSGWLRTVAWEARAACLDPTTQWMLFVCAGVYFAVFTALPWRGAAPFPGSLRTLPLHPDSWLCILLLIAALAYATHYRQAAGSTQALMLLAGAAIGKGARFWAAWGKPPAPPSSLAPWIPRKPPPAASRLRWLLILLPLLLAAAALWQPSGATQFQYRGIPRWSGPWDNPNLFGLLMGVGVVLGVGSAVSAWRLAGKSPSAGKCRILLPLAWGALATGLCGLGLLKSYSRGAWLGTACGLAVLGLQTGVWRARRWMEPSLEDNGNEDSRSSGSEFAELSSPPRGLHFFHRNWQPLFLLLLSLGILAFWQFRHTEFAPARRVFSVGNRNDFSWRNRVAAWEGALAIITDHPIRGVGWNQPERIYDQFYRAPKVAEGMAIQLNHPLMIGMTLGLPALLCFGMYAGLSLAPLDASHAQNRVRRLSRMQSVCRAGAVVLLVGLWFDGGLFNLSTGALFWVLLELGRESAFSTGRHAAAKHPGAPSPSLPVVARQKMPWLQPLLIALFVAALALTALAWAKARDPFHREWWSLNSPGGGKLSAVAMMPDRGGPFPMVVFTSDPGGSAPYSGEALRQFAELGLAAVGVEHGKANPAQDVAGALQAAGAGGRMEVFAGRGHGFEAEQPLLRRSAAEFCAQELGASVMVANNVRPSCWVYWVPVSLAAALLCAWRWTAGRRRTRRTAAPARWLQAVAGIALVLALLVSAARLALPLFHVDSAALKLAWRWCVRPALRADFDWLASQPGARNCRINDLLEHLDLAAVQRTQFAASLDAEDWRQFVLSPWIDQTAVDIAWRREFWEWMAPRVRRETDAEAAARIVAQVMRQRLRIVPAVPAQSPLAAWAQGATDAPGNERVYIAALRSIGIPARLNPTGKTEILSRKGWTPLPIQ